jgi:hypothetical protein
MDQLCVTTLYRANMSKSTSEMSHWRTSILLRCFGVSSFVSPVATVFFSSFTIDVVVAVAAGAVTGTLGGAPIGSLTAEMSSN